MLEKRVVFSQVECTPAGVIQVRLDKQVIDGETVFGHEYHRTVIEPGMDPTAQLAAVNEHLAAMGYPAVDPETTDRIIRIAAAEHTPEVVAAYLAARPS